jgi:hypothetical protein
MDCCVGDTPINFGNWYCQNGKTAEDCTYCEYCVNNKCIDVSQLYKLSDSTYHCTCDCPKKHSHPKLFCYFCPKCEIERFGMEPPKAGGACKKCKFQTPLANQAYCASCSIQLKSCYECGLAIKDGNSYITDVELSISKHVQEIKNFMIKDKDGKYQQQYLKTIEMLTSQLQKARELFANKTSEQMCVAIIDYQRKRFSQMSTQH